MLYIGDALRLSAAATDFETLLRPHSRPDGPAVSAQAQPPLAGAIHVNVTGRSICCQKPMEAVTDIIRRAVLTAAQARFHSPCASRLQV